MIPRIFEDFQDPDLDSLDNYINLNKNNLKHLKVLRLTDGASLILVNNVTNKSYDCILTKDSTQAKIIKLNNNLQIKSAVKSISFALTKGKRNDLVCEKATELNAEEIIFWQADHSIVKPSNIENKIKRWEKIAESAAKQSGKNKIPKINYLPDINSLVKHLISLKNYRERIFYASLSKGSEKIINFYPLNDSVHILVGPEGDFSLNEEKILRENEFLPITLGEYTLRSETAAIASVSAFNTIFKG